MNFISGMLVVLAGYAGAEAIGFPGPIGAVVTGGVRVLWLLFRIHQIEGELEDINDEIRTREARGER